MVHKAFKKAFKAVTKPLRTLRVFKFLQNINPWVALGIFAVGWLFMRSRKPDTPDYGTTDFDTTEKGILVNKQSNNASIPVVYGERLIGGTRVFISTSGTDNIYLYVALVLCEGEINSIEEIRVDDKVVTFDGALSDNVQRNVASSDSNFFKADPNVQGSSAESTIIIEPHFGTDGQSASSLLSTLSDWGTNHKLSGICYLALRFKWNPDVFGGIPTVQAKIKGKKIVSYNSSLVAQTPAFSTNPAFCLLDYLTNERYGKGLAISNINLQSFYDASVICETQVTPYSSASDINIFDCNAVIDTSKKVIDNVREIIKGMRGYLPFVQGKYRLNIETTGSASISLDEDDIIGGYALASPSKNSKYNRVIVSFVNPARNFQVDEIQFPPIDDSGLTSADRHSTMKSADGGFLLEGRFEFRTITSPYQAEEMAEIILRRSREALGLNINVGFEAFDLHVGDLVNITLTSLGFSNKTFRVLSMTFNEDFTIGLSLIEYQASHYTWATKTVVASTPATNLPNPFTIQAPASVTLSDEMIEYADGVVLTRLNILIGASSDAFVQYYQVEAKLSTESNFKIISNGQQLRHELLNVIDDATYDVRVKAINSFGVSSSYTSASRKIIGATEIPSDVDDLSVSMVGSNQMELSWTPVQDLDISWYEIRFQNVTSGATWNESTPIAKVVRRKSNAVTLNAQVGSYCIKAVDKLGNSSANASIVSTNISGLQNFTNVLTLSE
jgi:fibronectin type 3 domain-containing protein